MGVDILLKVLLRDQDPLAIPIAAQMAVADLLAHGSLRATQDVRGLTNSEEFKLLGKRCSHFSFREMNPREVLFDKDDGH